MRPSGGTGWRVGALVCGVTLAGGLMLLVPRGPVRAAAEQGEHFGYSETITPHPQRKPAAPIAAGEMEAPPTPFARPPAPPSTPTVGPAPHEAAPERRHAAGPRRTTSVELIGIASSGRDQTAVVRIGGRAMQLRVGSTIGAWKVAALNCRPLGDSSMVVTRAGVRRQLQLVSAAIGEAPAPPTPPPEESAPPLADPPGVSNLPQGPSPVGSSKRPAKGPPVGMGTPFPGEPPDAPHPVDPRDFDP